MNSSSPFPNLEGTIRLWRLTGRFQWFDAPKMSKNVLGFPAMPMDPVLAHSPRLWKYSSWFFFPSPHVIEAVKMDANMTSEGHHFSVACQILLLRTQPGPGAVLTSSVDRSSSVRIARSSSSVLLQLLQGFGGGAMARVGGVLQQLNGDVFVISSRIRNKGQKDGRKLEETRIKFRKSCGTNIKFSTNSYKAWSKRPVSRLSPRK